MAERPASSCNASLGLIATFAGIFFKIMHAFVANKRVEIKLQYANKNKFKMMQGA